MSRESLYLIGRHRLHFLLPLLTVLALLSLLAYGLGSSAVIAFLYAGL